MLFSVIIPTFNRAVLLPKTLESLWAQTFQDFEIIVVDDGSKDGTMDYLQTVNGRIQVLSQLNLGPGMARNAGAAVAKGKYIAFLDSDDLWFPWTLETYAGIIQQSDELSFIAGKPFRFRHEKELAGVVLTTTKVNHFSDYLASSSEWRWWGVSSFVILRDAFNAAGGFTSEWVNGEDADFALRLGTAPGFVQITAPPTFGYREHDYSAMKDFSKTVAGTWMSINAEKAGAYPGGAARALERWQILTRHVRPVTIDCLRGGLSRDASQLYQAMFQWHLALGRWKYLLGFPMKVLCYKVK